MKHWPLRQDVQMIWKIICQDLKYAGIQHSPRPTCCVMRITGRPSFSILWCRRGRVWSGGKTDQIELIHLYFQSIHCECLRVPKLGNNLSSLLLNLDGRRSTSKVPHLWLARPLTYPDSDAGDWESPPGMWTADRAGTCSSVKRASSLLLLRLLLSPWWLV